MKSSLTTRHRLIGLILGVVVGSFLVVMPLLAGQDQVELSDKPFKPQLAVPIGGVSQLSPVQCTPGQECQIPWLSQYISAIFQYGVGLAAALAFLMVMAGGFLWLTSGGSPDRVGKAKEFITSALTGLVLALFSVVLLGVINPRLVNLEQISLVGVQQGELPPPRSPTQIIDERNERIAEQSILGCCIHRSDPRIPRPSVGPTARCDYQSVETCNGQFDSFAGAGVSCNTQFVCTTDYGNQVDCNAGSNGLECGFTEGGFFQDGGLRMHCVDGQCTECVGDYAATEEECIFTCSQSALRGDPTFPEYDRRNSCCNCL